MLVGVVAGLLSGLLGYRRRLGDRFRRWREVLGVPLKRALGPRSFAVVVLVIPGRSSHAALGNIDWWVALFLVLGSLPGARLGATVTRWGRRSGRSA